MKKPFSPHDDYAVLLHQRLAEPRPSVRQIRQVLDLHVELLLEELVYREAVLLPGLGRLVLSNTKVARRHHWEPDGLLRLDDGVQRRIADNREGRSLMGMEKYSVEQGQEGDAKTAADRGKCPKCGRPLEKTASVHKCPEHGTEPFEKKPEEKADVQS